MVGLPKRMTWSSLKTVEMEQKQIGLKWGKAQALAKDKTQWRRDISAAPCPTRDLRDLRKKNFIRMCN